MEVGIRELRSNLAAIMDEVDKGTVVTIVHHGKLRATIQPAEPVKTESVVERGIREGWLTVGPGFYDKRRDRTPRVTLSVEHGRLVWEALMEDREYDR